MRLTTLVRGIGLLAVLVVSGCKSLDITNPNDPDAERALSDPAAIEAVTGGAMRVWINAWAGGHGDPNETGAGGVNLVTMAQTYTASWNNSNMNFYSSIDADGTRNSRPWQNDPSAAGRTSIEAYWAEFYSALSLATNVLRAIRINDLVINNDNDTKRAEAVALLMQGASLMGIAINYDKGYIIDETVDLGALTYSNRKLVRDAAMDKFRQADSVAALAAFTTPPAWTNGPIYTNVQIRKIANTMAAFTLANWPRNPAENAQVDWARVVTLATNGMSSGADFDFLFEGDGCGAWCPWIGYWFNGVDGGRVHTRLANLIDPASQATPYPVGGNPPPNATDDRMGDGSFGNASMIASFGNIPKTANAGTDFMWSSVEIFNMSRGSYHQSNIGHIRFDLSGTQSPTGIYGLLGPAPLLSAEQNDLLLAEGLLRQAVPDRAGAVTLINNTRVGRGGLPAALASETVTALLNKLNYELEIEALGQGPSSFYLRRRLGGLITGTPHEMPVPAKELGIFNQALYTWGGTGAASSPTPP